MMKRRFFLGQLLLAGALLAPRTAFAAPAEPTNPVQTLRVFSLGNSFTGNAWKYVRNIAAAANCKLITGGAIAGGCSLKQHWDSAEAWDGKLNDEKAKNLYGGKSLKELISRDKWDIVTIQQYSYLSPDISTYRPYAQNLKELIAQLAPGAELAIHETWAYRADDPLFHDPKNPYTQAQMYADVSKNYRTIAAELGVKRILPSGDAFNLVNTDPNWGYKPDPNFDPKTAVAPALPDQSHSLNMGYSWKEKDGKSTLNFDGHHANTNGCYLAGCVWFESLFGISPVGNTFIPEGMSQETAAYLQQKAHEAVTAEKARAK
jgi:hypothetical protein